MKKVLILTPGFSDSCTEALSILTNAGLEPVFLNSEPITSEDQVIDYVDDDVVAIIVGVEVVADKVMKKAKNLKLVSIFGAGVNPVVLEACKRNSIMLTRAPGANSNAVADCVIGLMLASSRQIITSEKELRDGVWKRYFCDSPYKKTLGLIGFGAVGKAVAKRAKGFSMRVVAYDPFWDEKTAKELGVEKCSYDEVLEQSDYVSLHLALTPETEFSFDKTKFAKMKSNAILINTARGKIINEADLCDAIKSGKIAGAALDTFVHEPLSKDDPLFGLENVILTPHIAADSFEARRSVSTFATSNVVYALDSTIMDKTPFAVVWRP